MKKIAALLFLAVLPIMAMSQDRLKTSNYLHGKAITDYEFAVERLLDAKPTALWGYLVKPSFSPEYALFCYKGQTGSELVLTKAKENIWYAKERRNQVKIDSIRLRINNSLADSIAVFFKYAVATSVIYPGYGPFTIDTDYYGNKTVYDDIGLDGTTYMFFNEGYAAECWSPHDGLCVELVKIGNELVKAVEQKDINGVYKVADMLQGPLDSLWELLPDWYKEYIEIKTEMKARGTIFP